ncbi:MAG TPA: SDR family NAD(P)-dependent oxidoreductase, partial [Spirochaetia bacterium]|nr:SDR family NAD(P)-dependent oxidoreductase [Spirochaetia bacterium]
MNLSNNEVLITGGGSGIGLGLAEIFLSAGSRVIICGRRKEALEGARRKNPGLVTFPCDLAREDERIRLAEWLAREHPTVNVLVNNAGIQQRMNFSQADFWQRARQEMAINWEAPVHLTVLLVDMLKKAPSASILNV